MKTRSRLFISTFFVLPMLSLAVTPIAHAVESDTTTTTTTETETKPDDKKLLERLNKRKEELKTKLNAADQARLKSKCKVAQTGAVSSLSGRIKGIETSRTQVHKNLVNRLEKLVEKLKAKEVDTTTLEAQITTLKTKIETFKTDLGKYKEAVSDLKSMDCTTDPDAFKASLESARSAREQVAKDGADIKAYVNDTIKPTLKDIRAKLAAAEATESDTSTTGGTQ